MSRLSSLVYVVLGASSLATMGCCDKYKQELAGLQMQYNDLQATNQDLKKSLAECQSTKAELSTQLANRGSELARIEAELDAAKLAKPQPAGDKAAPAGWQQTAEGVKITLSSDIAFASGRAALSTAGVAKLAKVAATIKSQYPDAVVRVYGYTDNDPIRKSRKLWKDNLELSANRAMAVSRELHRRGIEPDRVETIAMGDTRFIISNTTRAGKAKNRRVEIVVVK